MFENLFVVVFQEYISKRSDSRVPNAFPDLPSKENQTHELDDDPEEEENSSSSSN